MPRSLVASVLVVISCATAAVVAGAQVKQHGRAIVSYRGEDVLAVVSYEYSQRNHSGAWLLMEFAVQAKERIAIHRNELRLLGADERTYAVATQPEFLADQQTLTQLLQNARIWRRPLDSYFTSRPIMRTIRFFAMPGSGVVTDSAITNPDEVATGDLLFKSPDGTWKAGAYRLMLNHPEAKAELPITLQ